MPPTSPAVASWTLGLRLRRKRENLGITSSQASKRAPIAPTYLSDVERGKKNLSQERLEALIKLYELPDDESEQLRLLRQEANQRGWWARYSAMFSDDLLRYFGYEHGAETVRSYDGGLVHGLLQTEEYARAITQAGSPNVRLAEVDRRVEVRMLRQQRLTGSDPLHLVAVMSEAALRQQVGGAGVLAAQLEHLLDLAERLPENLDIRVVPYTATGHHAMGGSTFHLVNFPSGDVPALAWQETVTSAELIVDPIRTREYDIAHGEATRSALNRSTSLELIAELRSAIG
ncbi:helix-turn-helix transcriptional regulator [Saccharopolyspora sp. SCSIO 74807]|uniref:helix-turn-helix domain-containing protein n=1 Tax=Saccharopolyspora sp. SCSIO 74807 TaxID=3118084 RepID=UPI0030CB3BB2